MSCEILFADQPSTAPVFWRTVASARDTEGKPVRHDVERETTRHSEQVRREGFAEVFAAGRLEAEQQFLPAAQELAQTLAELARMRDVIREEATQDLVRLAMSIAARVIHREAGVDPDALAGLIRAAFAKLQSRELKKVRMHPGLEPLVRKCLEQAGSPANLSVIADSALNAGELFF